MRISHRFRFVYFANPKTGSASVRELVNPYSDISDDRPFHMASPERPFYGHMRPLEAREAFRRNGWRFEDYFRFTCVRNPWTRLVSLYEHMRRMSRGAPPSFADWLRASRPDGAGGGGAEGTRWLRYGTYTLMNFAGDGRGRLMVDEVVRMEDMAGTADLLRRHGIPIAAGATIPHKHVTNAGASASRYYTPDLIELVRERYADDIDTFGYEFPGA